MVLPPPSFHPHIKEPPSSSPPLIIFTSNQCFKEKISPFAITCNSFSPFPFISSFLPFLCVRVCVCVECVHLTLGDSSSSFSLLTTLFFFHNQKRSQWRTTNRNVPKSIQIMIYLLTLGTIMCGTFEYLYFYLEKRIFECLLNLDD